MKVKDTGGGEFENPQPGTYSAVCYRLIDLGTQTSEYQGRSSSRRQVLLSWEIDEAMSDGRPFSVSKFYTASLSEKANLRHDLAAWRGRDFTPDELAGFDLKTILGKPCMVTLTKTDTGKIKVAAVAKIAKGMAPIKQHNPTLYFSFETYDAAVLESLSDGLKNIIKRSPEYSMMSKGANGNGHADEPQFDDGPPPYDDDVMPF